jgi:hypothetical protein
MTVEVELLLGPMRVGEVEKVKGDCFKLSEADFNFFSSVGVVKKTNGARGEKASAEPAGDADTGSEEGLKGQKRK